jgi:peptide/nickel transport system permease protein
VLRLALRRILGAVPLLLGVATLVFVVLDLAPGDPSLRYLNPNMTQEVQDQITRNLGLDQPLPIRFADWLLAYSRGDFQQSLVRQIPVRDLISAALPNTLLLASGALLLSFLLGIGVGVLQAYRQGSFLDGLLSALTLFFYSMPSFWLAFMLILLFAVHGRDLWGLAFSFPVSGVASQGIELMDATHRAKDLLLHLFLPLLTLTLVLTAGIARYMRSSMLEVLRQDYVRTARAKGLSEFRVVTRHALRNALIPMVTLFGLYFPLLLSGTVLVEYVFAWPGMGRLLVNSVLAGDYPVTLAVTFLFGVAVVVGNLLADLLYGVVDPRVRMDHG